MRSSILVQLEFGGLDVGFYLTYDTGPESNPGQVIFVGGERSHHYAIRAYRY